jgi:hypothetical protein
MTGSKKVGVVLINIPHKEKIDSSVIDLFQRALPKHLPIIDSERSRNPPCLFGSGQSTQFQGRFL